MVDIKKAEEEFKIYANKYNLNELKILMKYNHTFRVEEISGNIAKGLGLDEEKVNLAKLIGLLHDIARFEQYTKYNTYDDLSSIDHADLAVDILKKDSYIRKYIETDKYDELILKAIENHNKYAIQNNLNEDEELFCKIVRDADKLDIFYTKITESLENEKSVIAKQSITKEVLEQFMRQETIDRKNVKNNIDRIIVLIAFIYDYNFKECYQIMRENNYIDKVIDMFEYEELKTKKHMEEIRKIAKDYIDNKIENR